MSEGRQRGPNHAVSRGRVSDKAAYFSASDVGAAKQHVVDPKLVSLANPYGVPAVDRLIRRVDADVDAAEDAAQAQGAFMRLMWEQGHEASEIARETGVNRLTVKQMAKRGKWQRK